MRAALLVAVLAISVSSVQAQPIGPAETVFQYLQSAFPGLSARSASRNLDTYYCAAYALLYSKTRESLSAQVYVAALRRTGIYAERIEIGTPFVEGEWASVNVRYRATHWLLGPIDNVNTFVRTAKEDGAWKIVLSESAVSGYRQSGERSSNQVSPDVCR